MGLPFVFERLILIGFTLVKVFINWAVVTTQDHLHHHFKTEAITTTKEHPHPNSNRQNPLPTNIDDHNVNSDRRGNHSRRNPANEDPFFNLDDLRNAIPDDEQYSVPDCQSLEHVSIHSEDSDDGGNYDERVEDDIWGDINADNIYNARGIENEEFGYQNGNYVGNEGYGYGYRRNDGYGNNRQPRNNNQKNRDNGYCNNNNSANRNWIPQFVKGGNQRGSQGGARGGDRRGNRRPVDQEVNGPRRRLQQVPRGVNDRFSSVVTENDSPIVPPPREFRSFECKPNYINILLTSTPLQLLTQPASPAINQNTTIAIARKPTTGGPTLLNPCLKKPPPPSSSSSSFSPPFENSNKSSSTTTTKVESPTPPPSAVEDSLSKTGVLVTTQDHLHHHFKTEAITTTKEHPHPNSNRQNLLPTNIDDHNVNSDRGGNHSRRNPANEDPFFNLDDLRNAIPDDEQYSVPDCQSLEHVSIHSEDSDDGGNYDERVEDDIWGDINADNIYNARGIENEEFGYQNGNYVGNEGYGYGYRRNDGYGNNRQPRNNNQKNRDNGYCNNNNSANRNWIPQFVKGGNQRGSQGGDRGGDRRGNRRPVDQEVNGPRRRLQQVPRGVNDRFSSVVTENDSPIVPPPREFSNGTLLNNHEEDDWDFLERMSKNSKAVALADRAKQHLTSRSWPDRDANSKDRIETLERELVRMKKKEVGAVQYTVCEECGDIGHRTENCQAIADVNQVYGDRRQYDVNSNTYHPGFWNHPNFRYGNASNQMNTNFQSGNQGGFSHQNRQIGNQGHQSRDNYQRGYNQDGNG
ncbi:GATA zinc finger domain-containing protein 14-like [Helianthus annuus]|uniref:GATA zinc finger domain-containing protein 14-like n=1 Tax=Helianthus annuus TaxID=4232 RepID=UPI0016534084|nr:GATA zinc finger domain-containing protein 14-like [Helianthus annuus]